MEIFIQDVPLNNVPRFRCANPAYTPDELAYQITITKAKLLITHSSCLQTAETAARTTGIPTSNIIVIDSQYKGNTYPTIDAVMTSGLSKEVTFVERRLKPGEARTKLALLIFSSGTTGRPKAVAIPHFAVVANLIQMAAQCRVNEDYAPWSERRYRVGDVVYAGERTI